MEFPWLFPDRWTPWRNIKAVCYWPIFRLTHWGRVTHICVAKLTIIGSDNGLSPGRHQAIIWNNAGLLLIEPLGTNFSEISIVIQTFSFKKIHLNMSSAKWRPFCLGLNVLIHQWQLDSPHKGPIMQKTFPCHHSIIASSETLFYQNAYQALQIICQNCF